MLPHHLQWLDREEYPFNSSYYHVNGQQLHYIDEGQGEIILFVHGTPAWSFEYRKLIKNLKGMYRCIALDHMGFGLSDKPQEYDYSTANHSKTLEKFILSKNLQNITLVVHDFGGPIGLNFGINHPDKIKKLVILNSWCWNSEDEHRFIKLKKILSNPLLPFLYKFLNFSPKYLLPKSYVNKPDHHILKHYTKPFENHKQRQGVLAFALSLLNDQKWFGELWNKRQTIACKRTLFIWGIEDKFILPYHLEKFERNFQNSISIRLQCGHSPQEEEASMVTQAIVGFMKE